MTIMKKTYVRPVLEIERYQLDTNIAGNCGIVVDNGPAIGDHKACDNYKDPFEMSSGMAELMGGSYNVHFYEDTNCDCYTTGGNYGYWTS